jgi:hypothetical protein
LPPNNHLPNLPIPHPSLPSTPHPCTCPLSCAPQFYFHPGSGLYYSLTHAAYFRHTPHTHPPFTRFDPPPPPEPPTYAHPLPPTLGFASENSAPSYSPVSTAPAQQPLPATVLNLKVGPSLIMTRIGSYPTLSTRQVGHVVRAVLLQL